MKNEYLIEIHELSKSYNISNNNKINIINNLNINFKKNCKISIVGPSGSGKSTFLNILGLLDTNYVGEYFFNGNNVKNMNKNKVNKIRGLKIGFVHQFFHLIPELTVIENVMLPILINKNENDAPSKAKNLLKKFGLEERLNFKPIKLSGGEQQRVAIARSLINNPELILADEMTGNLDENTAKEIFDFFIKYINDNNKSLIYVTHNKDFSKRADEIYFLNNKTLKQ